MYHSITIGTNLLNSSGTGVIVSKNTWDDWHLIPTSRPLVNPPSPNINRIQIPGGDGSLDVTDILAGRPTYSDRNGSWSFYVENGYMPWSFLYSDIMKYLHGKYLQCVLEDDPAYYYEGRFSVNEWRSDASRSMITINYILSPYKVFNSSGENWLWDTFFFGDPRIPDDTGDEIKSYKNLKVNAGQTKSVVIDKKFGGCTFSVYTNKANVTFVYKQREYALKKGAYTAFDDIVFPEDKDSTLAFLYAASSGSATFSIYLRGGIL